MSETCQKLAVTHPIVVLKIGLKNNWMKKLDRVNRPLRSVKRRENFMLNWTLVQIKAFTKYNFYLMTPFIQYNWTVLFLDVPIAAHVVES